MAGALHFVGHVTADNASIAIFIDVVQVLARVEQLLLLLVEHRLLVLVVRGNLNFVWTHNLLLLHGVQK